MFKRLSPALKAAALAALLLALPLLALAQGGHGEMGRTMSLFLAIPFAGILLSIALMPLLTPHFWHHHFGKVSAAWGLLVAVPLVAIYGGDAIAELLYVALADYLPFIILLWALFTVSGGIYLSGSLSGTPLGNLSMLLIGTLLASVFGTTGAAMLMIRPFLRANSWRSKNTHQAVFFIFLVCNVGGSLTPLGDPPLFLGFLHGVSFFWTLKLILPMLFVTALLSAAFFALDSHYFSREAARPEAGGAKLKIEGGLNLIYLALIVLAVLLSGTLKLGNLNILGVERTVADLLRDAALIAIGFASLKTTSVIVREKNGFSWYPIIEVAILFAGIFTTMIPVIMMLKAGSHGPFALIVNSVKEPAHYFWATGALSSFLDNAPTYLVFFNTALGSFYPGMAEPEAVKLLMSQNPLFLEAISAGAVFMGANSYIGNAPNFMVRSIAEESGVAMPSFFGYILKYALVFLIPSFILATVIFF
ncbi:sodium:proton antiporter [bacterium]|nr:MAG: sodium:proton antiporter [bacterium]